MSAFENAPLLISQGDKFTMTFPLNDESDQPADYDTPEVVFELFKRSYAIEDETPILIKDSGSRGGVRVVKSGSQWTAYADFLADETKGNPYVHPGSHYYQLRVIDGVNDRGTVATGLLVIKATGGDGQPPAP
jgi:hypothetical protein